MNINTEIQCFCCKKRLNLFSVEPEFYCYVCVNLKEIHNAENGVNPVKWYSKIYHEIKTGNAVLNEKVEQISRYNKINKWREFQRRRCQIENIKVLINRLKAEKEIKIQDKKSINKKQMSIQTNIKEEIKKSLVTEKRIEKLTLNQKDLFHKILDIQEYMNKLQCIIVEEILKLFPITLCKYEPDQICGIPLHIDLSDSLVLESNDSTASAILLLTILSTSISYILDLCFSSMDIRRFALQTIYQRSTPLTRDEIMCVYQFLVKIVHHITQSTLHRDDIDKKQLTKSVPVDSLTRISIDDLSAENYPLKKLVMLRDNLKVSLIMTGISNPYILHLANMFQNEYINDFSICSRIDCVGNERAAMDFVELSSIIPLNELPSIYRSSGHVDNPLLSEWLSWVKKGLY